MSKPKKWTTDKRGHELLVFILDRIKREAADTLNHQPGEDNVAGLWNQSTWGVFDLKELSDHGLLSVTREGATVTDARALNECGTACCFAGHTVLAAGDLVPVHPVVPADHVVEYNWASVIAPNGLRTPVDVRAAELLGIGADDAEVLFRSSNTLEALEVVVKAILEGADPQEALEFAGLDDL